MLRQLTWLTSDEGISQAPWDTGVVSEMSGCNSCVSDPSLRATGTIAVTLVPQPCELISNVPPNIRNIRSRSLIPRNPTPLCVEDLRVVCFSGGIPFPESSISTLSNASSRVMRIFAVRLAVNPHEHQRCDICWLQIPGETKVMEQRHL